MRTRKIKVTFYIGVNYSNNFLVVRFVETTEAKIFEGGIYSTLVIGENAYGVTEIEGGGLEHIVKQLGSAGTADALNQRATVGWKATKTAEILVDEYMVRVETGSTFS